MFFDTSFCVDLLREQAKNEEGPARQKLMQLGNTPNFMSIFVVCELQAGARLSGSPQKELNKIQLLSEFFEIVYTDRAYAALYGEIEAYLRKRGTPIPTMDLLIGSAAKQNGLPIVSRDSIHFAKIPGLIVESYAA